MINQGGESTDDNRERKKDVSQVAYSSYLKALKNRRDRKRVQQRSMQVLVSDYSSIKTVNSHTDRKRPIPPAFNSGFCSTKQLGI